MGKNDVFLIKFEQRIKHEKVIEILFNFVHHIILTMVNKSVKYCFSVYIYE